MPNLRLDRRAVLKGAGTIAIALPWLEIMTSARRAYAAGVTPAQRFVAVYTPGGTVIDRWRPTGTEMDFTLSPILKPLEPVKPHIIVVDGVDMKSAVGQQRGAGMIAWLTGTPQVGPSTLPAQSGGPSIDQVLATGVLAKPGRLKRSVELAIRWGTGQSHGLPSQFDITAFENTPAHPPIRPALDPAAIWRELFGALPPGGGATGLDRSILDHVERRYVRLAARLGAADKQRLDQHLSALRDIERRLPAGPSVRCAAPVLADTTGYNPLSGLNSADNGSIRDLETDAAIPKVGKLMTDMLVMALACDLTAVGTLQWADCQAKYTLPWLGLTEHHYFYQNDGGYHPTVCEAIGTWYATQHAYLLQEMAKVDMGGHTLLDESVVFFGSEVQGPANHSKTDMPFLLAGGGGGLRTGRFLRYDRLSHNDLLVSIFNLFGDTRRTFGDTRYCLGPAGRLT